MKRLAMTIFMTVIAAVSAAHAQDMASVRNGHEARAVALASPVAENPADPMDPTYNAPQFPGLAAKWQRIEAQIATDTRRLATCRNDIAGCTDSELAFIAMIAQVDGKDGRARLGLINRAVNLAIRPESDLRRFGKRDVWSAPLDTLADGAGDCEDYAILKMLALLEAGLDPADLRLAIVREPAARSDHAVLTARLDGRWVVLDNRGFVLADFEDTRYALLAAFRTEPSDRAIGLAQGPQDVPADLDLM